jgi:hypothetical protein
VARSRHDRIWKPTCVQSPVPPAVSGDRDHHFASLGKTCGTPHVFPPMPACPR